MQIEAQKMGFFVEVSSYAYSVRGEYDKDGRLKLPPKYFDNIDRKIISNNIYAQTFPSIEYMADVIKRQEGEKIIVWGAGKVGKKVIQILRSHGMKIIEIIDSNSSLCGTLIEDIPIMSPDKVLAEKPKCIIILAGSKGKEMLRIINEINFSDATVYWMLHE